MNKAQLVAAVARDLGTSKLAAERAVNSVLRTITKNLRPGVSITGFGSFHLASRKACNGTDPRNGNPIRIKACKTVRFKAGKALKNRL